MPADDDVAELHALHRRILTLRVTLTAIEALAQAAPLDRKTLTAIERAARHALDRDEAARPDV